MGWGGTGTAGHPPPPAAAPQARSTPTARSPVASRPLPALPQHRTVRTVPGPHGIAHGALRAVRTPGQQREQCHGHRGDLFIRGPPTLDPEPGRPPSSTVHTPLLTPFGPPSNAPLKTRSNPTRAPPPTRRTPAGTRPTGCRQHPHPGPGPRTAAPPPGAQHDVRHSTTYGTARPDTQDGPARSTARRTARPGARDGVGARHGPAAHGTAHGTALAYGTARRRTARPGVRDGQARAYGTARRGTGVTARCSGRCPGRPGPHAGRRVPVCGTARRATAPGRGTRRPPRPLKPRYGTAPQHAAAQTRHGPGIPERSLRSDTTRRTGRTRAVRGGPQDAGPGWAPGAGVIMQGGECAPKRAYKAVRARPGMRAGGGTRDAVSRRVARPPPGAGHPRAWPRADDARCRTPSGGCTHPSSRLEHPRGHAGHLTAPPATPPCFGLRPGDRCLGVRPARQGKPLRAAGAPARAGKRPPAPDRTRGARGPARATTPDRRRRRGGTPRTRTHPHPHRHRHRHRQATRPGDRTEGEAEGAGKRGGQARDG